MARTWRAAVLVLALTVALPAAGHARGFGSHRSPSFFAHLWQTVVAFVTGVTPDLGPTSNPDG
jgi:hypothetical protein